MNATSPSAPRFTPIQWLIVSLAAIGFAFDIYELLMMQFIARDLLMEFGLKPGSPEFSWWGSVIFYVPPFMGGLFGLLGGYMTDRLGRRRVLTWSILLYALSAFAAGFSTSLEMFLVLRCLTLIGVCVEFVAAIAWLAELFPDPHRRESVLGYTQAFSSLGGFMVAGAFWVASKYAMSWPTITMPLFLSSLGGEIVNGNAAWRYTLMSGLIPALPLIVIRPFLPESPAWAAKRAAGTLRRPRFRELFAPDLRRTTIVSTILFACAYGAAFGAVQQVPQIVPGFPEVQERIASLPPPQQAPIVNPIAGFLGFVQEFGGLTGRFLLAYLAVRIVSRRTLLRVFQVPALLLVPLIFVVAPANGANAMAVGIFIAGLFTVSQFSFLGNYLPRVYPLHLRGTGESFAANVGGRMIGTFGYAVTSFLSLQITAGSPAINRAYASAIVALAVFLIGSIACFWLPEPAAEALPD